MNKNIKLIAPFTAFCLSALTACSAFSVNGTASNTEQVKISETTIQGKISHTVDMGYKNGISFAVKINIAENKGFSIKAPANENKPGHNYTGTDINRVKVFLFAQPSFTSGSSIAPDSVMPSGNPITFTSKTGTSEGGSFDVVFTNVPGNENPWRVAVTALTTLTAAGGSTGTPKNITLGDGSTNFGTFNSENYAVSNTGGDSDSGAVLIDPVTLSLTGTTALGISLTLIDAFFATLDTNISISDGSSAITPGSTYVE